MLKLKQTVQYVGKFNNQLFHLKNNNNTHCLTWCRSVITRGKQDDSTVSRLFQPAPIKESSTTSIGIELTGKIDRTKLLDKLNVFSNKKEIHQLCQEYGLDEFICKQSFASFRRYCFEVDKLPAELYIKLYDIVNDAAHADDLFPYFLKHAKAVYPHLDCMNDLKKISNLTNPANWYPDARAKTRKIIFHAGPTNSGKTYQAMQRFLNAKSGIYCGPLKLLATEVYFKSNKLGTPCDLVTGEEKKYANTDETPASHVACTVEMATLSRPFEVAIIDEIQLLKDQLRGYAWTRAFLGLNADEIHVCGEAGTLNLLEKLCNTTGEAVEVNTYKRLTELTVEDKALVSIDSLEPGDCIVCFNKKDLYSVSMEIESRGKEVAVIYGSLPPNTKLVQAAKFNDPDHNCKVLVATDAIGMGLNLSIRRVIFYSLTKPNLNENGQKEISTISVSSALQIAGRAGRYGTQYEHGYVTTFKSSDLSTLQYLLKQSPEPILQAGLHPTPDQIELYAYHLPNSTLSNLLDIFVSLSIVDDLYFMCKTEDFKFLADMVQHIPLSLRARYVFCCAPINQKMTFACTMFSKFATLYSKYEPITYEFVAKNCEFPLSVPNTIAELVHLENVFDVLDVYLWLSYRFTEMFPHADQIRSAQIGLDELIQEGVLHITRLLTASISRSIDDIEDNKDSKKIIDSKISSAELFRHLSTSKAATGPLTQRLLTEGLITPTMIKQLHREWELNQSTRKFKTKSKEVKKK